MQPPADGLASRLLLGPALRTQPDRRLVTLVRQGYEAAFEEIVRRYGRPLTRYATTIVGSRSEDITQDAFSKALLALRRDGEEIELRPWLFRIVRNTALNDLRDNPPSPEVLAEAIVGGRNPAEELEQREELADLIKRLRALPEPQRAAIVMRELEGLGHEEIARALGLSGGAARQAIYRARRALRDGAGMLVPLPLLQTLLAGSGPGAAEAAAGAAGIGGAGVALKATAATVLVAGAVGAGVALDSHPRNSDAKATVTRGREVNSDDVVLAPTTTLTNEERHGDDGRRSRGKAELGEDHGGRGSKAGEDRSSQGGEPGDDRGGSGRDGSGSGSGHADRSGPSHHGDEAGSGRGGPGPGESGSGGGSGRGAGGGPSPELEPNGGGGPGPSADPAEGENPESVSGSGSSEDGSGKELDGGDGRGGGPH